MLPKLNYSAVWRGVVCSFAVGFLILSGCNSGPKLVPISGQVMIDGKPLERGIVMVWVKDHRPSSGAIGKDGRFALMTRKPGDGCVVGEHPVSVSSEMGLKDESTQIFIPVRYGDPKQSGLTLSVAEPKDDWVIDLTWKGDSHTAPYIVK
jgi:hypothetical protein